MIPSPTILLAGLGGVCVFALLRARLDRYRGWRRTFDALAWLEVGAIAILLVTLVTLGAVQIVLRNTMQTGILWAEPMMRHIVLWLGGLGAGLATARVRHINIDVFSRLLPSRLAPTRRVIVYGATAICAFVLAIAAIRLVAQEREFGDVAFLNIQVWVLQLVLPYAFLMIAYRSLVNLFLAREPEPTTGGIDL